ncbi:MAG: hypothetical protein LT103_13210 [Burkholderiaceae bacterium]|nr:hypothetical protein [Burkholderiaceae bacterium]
MKARTLLVFHSRTGYTRTIASKIAAACDCDVEELHDEVGKAAFFCTCGSSGDRRALAEFEALCGPAAASLAFTDGEIDRADPAAKVAGFVRQLGIGKTNGRSARKTARR